jgi:hypothetical protein
VEPGPLPPHERAWRHPSELGPTSHDVDAASSLGPHAKMLAAASGALAVMLIVAIVVTATPSPSSAPTALSATTNPAVAFVASSVDKPAATRHTIAPAQALLMVSMSPVPNEIASAPELDVEGPTVAARLPKSSEAVMIQTSDVTYRCTWGDVEWLEMPDGTMVADDRGELVAHVDEGKIVALVEDAAASSAAAASSKVLTSNPPTTAALDQD